MTPHQQCEDIMYFLSQIILQIGHSRLIIREFTTPWNLFRTRQVQIKTWLKSDLPKAECSNICQWPFPLMQQTQAYRKSHCSPESDGFFCANFGLILPQERNSYRAAQWFTRFQYPGRGPSYITICVYINANVLIIWFLKYSISQELCKWLVFCYK